VALSKSWTMPAQMEHAQEMAELFKPFDESSDSSELRRVEYWSKTYRTWIPADIVAINSETQKLQINVKPGMWLSFSDFGKKLRVAVYARSTCINDRDGMSQVEYDSINEASQADTKGRENIDTPQFKERSLNCQFDQISRGHGADVLKDFDSREQAATKPDKKLSQINIDTLPDDFANEEHFQQSLDSTLAPGSLQPVYSNGDVVADVRSQACGQEASEVPERAASDMDWIPALQQRVNALDICEPTVRAHDTNQQAHVESASSCEAAATKDPAMPYITATSLTGASSALSSEGRFAGYRCPNCGAGGLESVQDALDHCGPSPVGAMTRRVSIIKRTVACEDAEDRFCMEADKGPIESTSSNCQASAGPDVEDVSNLLRPSLTPRAPSSAASDDEHQAPEADLQQESSDSAPAVSSSVKPADAQPKIVTIVGADAAIDEAPSCNGEPAPPLASDPLDAGYKKPKTRILGYCCPKCGTGQLETLQDAVQHCRKPEDTSRILWEGITDDGSPKEAEDTAAADSLPSAGTPNTAAPCEPTLELQAPPPMLAALPGEPVAFNSYGQPIIARQVDPETGLSRTMVLNDDGTCDVFGKQTIASLLSSTETETDAWMEVLGDYQMRGLVHEMGQRLVESSQVYQARLNQWQGLTEKANLAYFGLSEGCTDRELDVAYRQLSKKMHPDKNGGTEESKERFQEMKTRYEDLKKKRSEEGDKKEEENKQQEQAEDDEEAKPKDDKTIEFDPGSRESLHATAKKMLSQLGTLDSGMANLVQQLRRHGL